MVPCSHLCEVRRGLVLCGLGVSTSSGRGEMICGLSFLCGLFSDDPRLRMPHAKDPVVGVRNEIHRRATPMPMPPTIGIFPV
jgi:hypothetical protein